MSRCLTPGRCNSLWIWAIAFAVLGASLATAAETGTILGQIADERGQVTYVGNAVVFLCDAKTGYPLVAQTKKIYELGDRAEGLKDFWHAVTTDKSVFEFQDVPAGRYRLVAQSWSATKGLPEPSAQTSTIVMLHGVAEDVEVKAGEVTRVYPQKLGDGVLKIVNDPEEGHAFLLISQKPRLGEGVLGPAGWGPEFLSRLIGITRMDTGYVTLIGLPKGKEIHVGLMNFDNNAGVGGDSYVVGKHDEVRLEIFATWSNGKHDPPQRLLKLTEHFEQQNLSVSKLLGLAGTDRENEKAILKMLREKSDEKIKVEDVGTFRLADILAASEFRALRKSHRDRQRR